MMQLVDIDLMDGNGLVQLVAGSDKDMMRIIRFIAEAKALMLEEERDKELMKDIVL